MIDLEREQLDRSPQWRLVLEQYAAAEARAKRGDDGHEGWLPRLGSVDGVDGEHLPQIHGRLIALGLLSFQLAGRTSGVLYRVSSAGRQLLCGNAATSDDETEPSDVADAA